MVVVRYFLDVFMVFILLNIIFAISPVENCQAGAKREINVLLLLPFPSDYPVCEVYVKGIKSGFKDEKDFSVRYNFEYIDLLHFADKSAYLRTTATYFQAKYKDWQPDIIIASCALDNFFKRYGQDMFPGVPVVMEWNEINLPRKEQSNWLHAVSAPLDFEKTIDVILQTKQNTKNIYIIIGDSAEECRYYNKLKDLEKHYFKRVKFVFIHKMSYEEMVAQVNNVYGNSAILFVRWATDGYGEKYIPMEVLKEVCSIAKVPVYATNSQFLGTGIVGGYLYSYEIIGKNIAQAAINHIKGNMLSDHLYINMSSCEYAFDWREIKRWGIEENKLPQGSRLEFKEQNLWNEYKDYILLGVIGLCFETALICCVIVAWIRQRKAKQELLFVNMSLEQRNEELNDAQEKLVQLNELLDITSKTDSLTGLYNRRYIDERIRQEYEKFSRTGRTFGIIMADIDYFKHINDLYGHDVGDFVLADLANDMKMTIRPYDVVARWGGEEILFLLPEVEFQEIADITERLRKVVDEKNYYYKQIAIKITITVGAAISHMDDNVISIIKRADIALYNGKIAGRNCVVLAEF